MSQLKTSPSQLETAALCRRKWWLAYVKKLGVPRGRQFIFGSVLHAACERYLLGQELWPEGWEDDPDTKLPVTPAEGALIQVLVQAGIEAGIIERRPGGEVEQWIHIPYNEHAVVRGLVDYGTDSRVEDHKTSKSERYMKSPEGLRKSIQMMVYARERVNRFRKRGELPPAVITLVHNQFKKDFDDPMVRRREAEVTPAEIDEFWEDTVVPLIENMLVDRHVTNPFDLPDPKPSACRAFGGCDFISVCSGAETLLSFEKRMTKLMAQDKKPKTIMNNSPSDFLSRRAGHATPAATPSINPPPPPEIKQEQPKAEPEASNGDVSFQTPPWFSEKCPICAQSEFKGFNLKTGKPCRICPTKSKVTAEGYVWSIEGGVPVWHKEGAEPVSGPAPSQVTDKGSKISFSAEDAMAQMRKAATVDDCDEILLRSETIGMSEVDSAQLAMVYSDRVYSLQAVEPEAAEPEAVKEVEAAVVMKKPVKVSEEPPEPKISPEPEEVTVPSGLTLLIGCAPLKGMDIVFAEEVLSKVEGYWSNKNAFDRREGLRRAIEGQGELLSALQGMTIVQQGRDPDIDNLMSSLIPHASVVIRGTIQ